MAARRGGHPRAYQITLTPNPANAASLVTIATSSINAWTGSMINDRVVRLDTKTGRFTEYLLPKTTNIRRVFVDNNTTPPTFWAGSNHGANIIKLETLE